MTFSTTCPAADDADQAATGTLQPGPVHETCAACGGYGLCAAGQVKALDGNGLCLLSAKPLLAFYHPREAENSPVITPFIGELYEHRAALNTRYDRAVASELAHIAIVYRDA